MGTRKPEMAYRAGAHNQVTPFYTKAHLRRPDMRLLLQSTSSSNTERGARSAAATQISVERPGVFRRLLKLLSVSRSRPVLRPDASEIVFPAAQLAGHVLVTGEPGFGSEHFFEWLLQKHLQSGGGFLMLDGHNGNSHFSRASRAVSAAGRAEDFQALLVQDFAASPGDGREVPWLRMARAMRLREGLYAGMSVMHADALSTGRGAALLDGLEAAIERRLEMESNATGQLPQFLVVITEVDQFPAARLATLLEKGAAANVAFLMMTASLTPVMAGAGSALAAAVANVGTVVVFRQRAGASARLAEERLVQAVRLGEASSSPPVYLLEAAAHVRGLLINECVVAHGASITPCRLVT